MRREWAFFGGTWRGAGEGLNRALYGGRIRRMLASLGAAPRPVDSPHWQPTSNSKSYPSQTT